MSLFCLSDRNQLPFSTATFIFVDMKRALTAIVLVIYFAVSSGFVVSMHYCMDRLASFQIGESSEHDKCGKCGMKKERNCCKDEVVIVKLETTHLASKVLAPDFSIPVADKPVQTEFLFFPLRNHVQSENFISHSPPLSEQKTYLSNCVFRI